MNKRKTYKKTKLLTAVQWSRLDPNLYDNWVGGRDEMMRQNTF
uniref:Uncharacterized protein n=1 Tax=Rhizophora mucronata TaxID=61149 RepID=A0A2P2KVC6_RHIMU